MPTVHGERRGVCRCNPPDRSGLDDAARLEPDEVRVLCFFWAPAMKLAEAHRYMAVSFGSLCGTAGSVYDPLSLTCIGSGRCGQECTARCSPQARV